MVCDSTEEERHDGLAALAHEGRTELSGQYPDQAVNFGRSAGPIRTLIARLRDRRRERRARRMLAPPPGRLPPAYAFGPVGRQAFPQPQHSPGPARPGQPFPHAQPSVGPPGPQPFPHAQSAQGPWGPPFGYPSAAPGTAGPGSGGYRHSTGASQPPPPGHKTADPRGFGGPSAPHTTQGPNDVSIYMDSSGIRIKGIPPELFAGRVPGGRGAVVTGNVVSANGQTIPDMNYLAPPSN